MHYTLKKADKIIATTKTCAETSLLLRNFMNKVEIVPMGVDLKKYSIKNREKQVKKFVKSMEFKIREFYYLLGD